MVNNSRMRLPQHGMAMEKRIWPRARGERLWAADEFMVTDNIFPLCQATSNLGRIQVLTNPLPPPGRLKHQSAGVCVCVCCVEKVSNQFYWSKSSRLDLINECDKENRDYTNNNDERLIRKHIKTLIASYVSVFASDEVEDDVEMDAKVCWTISIHTMDRSRETFASSESVELWYLSWWSLECGIIKLVLNMTCKWCRPIMLGR